MLLRGILTRQFNTSQLVIPAKAGIHNWQWMPGQARHDRVAYLIAGLITWTVMVIVSLGVAGGCSPLDAKYSSTSSGGKPEVAGKAGQAEPVSPKYSDFKDVLVLGELEEDKRHSSVILQGDTGTGFMSYFGRVEIQSIVNFFSIKMPQDGWTAITVQKSPFSTIMIFSKGKRWCTITIREKGFTTEVQIGVAPEIEKE